MRVWVFFPAWENYPGWDRGMRLGGIGSLGYERVWLSKSTSFERNFVVISSQTALVRAAVPVLKGRKGTPVLYEPCERCRCDRDTAGQRA